MKLSALRGRRALLVASTGGHLAQIVRWSHRLGLREDSVFATFDSEQSRSLLAGRDVVLLDYVPPRGFREALGATARLRRETRGQDFDVVISTGAAVGLAAYVVGRLRRTPVVYIESVSRFDGPSATGRILERLPRVTRYGQHAAWAGRPGWELGPSLLDDYTVEPAPALAARESGGRSVFVSLGTIRPFRFDSLVDAVRDQLRPGDTVTWQLGVTERDDLPGTVAGEIGAAEFDRLVAESDVFVTHSGVGTLLRALELGVRPVVVPRRSSRGEHVDDHQLQVARELAERGLVVLREPHELTSADLDPAGVTVRASEGGEVTDRPQPTMRVTQFGNASGGPGGVASVVRTMNSWADDELEVREWPTHWHGDRLRSLTELARTALRALTTRTGSADVWHFHLTQRGSFLREGALLALAARRGVHTTVLVHGSRFVSFVQAHPRLSGWVLRRASTVFVLTDAAREVLRPLGLATEKVANAVPVEPQAAPTERTGFVFAGEVGRRKGVDVLLDAWAAAGVSTQQLSLLGGLEPGYQLPDQLPDGVVVEGAVPPEQVLARLRTSRALVLPSRAEAMPMSVLESMSVGTPVIGTDVGQVAEVVGTTGLVVPAGDRDALAEAIRRLADSPELADELGREARDRAQEHYSTEAVKRVFVARWSEGLAGRRPEPAPGRAA